MTKESLITAITTPKNLEAAYRWVCKTSKNTNYAGSSWQLRTEWQEIKEELIDKLSSNSYHLSSPRRYNVGGRVIMWWKMEDAVVLQAIAMVLAKVLRVEISAKAKDKKKMAEQVQKEFKNYQFACKSAISACGSVDSKILLARLRTKINDKTVLRLVREYCAWFTNDFPVIGGVLECPLSSLFVTWLLRDLDRTLASQKVYYVRLLGEWVILTKTRNHLRKAIKTMAQTLAHLKFKKDRQYSFIGWIHKGFKFLGYNLTLTEIQGDEATQGSSSWLSKLLGK